MKKILTVLLSFVVLSFGALFFTACGNDNAKDTLDVYLPDGTPGLALAEAITEGVDEVDMEIKYHIVNASEIGGLVSNGSADLAIMPTNAAATIYKSGAKIQLMSSNVFGNLFIVGVGEADSLADLAGKEVYVTVGTTSAMLKYLCEENEIELNATPVDDGKEIIAKVKAANEQGEECYGVLGEPQVTACKKQVSSAKTVVDFQAEWKTLTGGDSYPQASLVVNTDFAKDNAKAAEAFANSLATNAEWIAKTENIAALKTALQEMGYTSDTSALISAPITTTTVENCNLGFVKSDAVKESVKEYVSVMNKGQQLDDKFFYTYSA